MFLATYFEPGSGTVAFDGRVPAAQTRRNFQYRMCSRRAALLQYLDILTAGDIFAFLLELKAAICRYVSVTAIASSLLLELALDCPETARVPY